MYYLVITKRSLEYILIPQYTPSRRRSMHDSDLGPEFLKSWSRKRFSEAVSKLVMCCDMSNTENLVLYLASNKVVINRNVFHSRMKDWICAQVGCPDVVTVDSRRC